jgi:Putative auto-transporter adhesin, head GIN domain
MRHFGLRLLTLALASVALAASAADLGREPRPVSNFERIVLRGVGDVTIEQTGVESLVVEAERRLLPLIRTEVERGVLYLDLKAPGVSTRYPIRYRLTVRTLSGIRAEGSGQVSSAKLAGNSMEIALDGSATLKLNRLEADALKARLAGSGSASILAGMLSVQTIELAGAGDYQAPKLASKHTAVHISGSGNASVTAADTLTARISGAGDIRYWGRPKVKAEISGAGVVERGGF